jgi:hypothetical protein
MEPCRRISPSVAEDGVTARMMIDVTRNVVDASVDDEPKRFACAVSTNLLCGVHRFCSCFGSVDRDICRLVGHRFRTGDVGRLVAPFRTHPRLSSGTLSLLVSHENHQQYERYQARPETQDGHSPKLQWSMNCSLALKLVDVS